MQDLQNIYNRIQDSKARQKGLRLQYKDALASAPDYQNVKEKLDGYRLRKKQIENEVKNEMAGTLLELAKVKKSIADDQQMLSEISMGLLMKGKKVEISGKDDATYEPVFVVRFRRREDGTAFKG